MKDIIETLNQIGPLKTFIMLLKIADLANSLDTQGPYTVFAPLDEAFDELPNGMMDRLRNGGEELNHFLNNHLVSGDLMTADLEANPLLETVGGGKLLLDRYDETLTINDRAAIVQADVGFIDGEIQVIDSILLPTGE
jgi:uncharacterized surface protein with fasciclin (FAS1) repeats